MKLKAGILIVLSGIMAGVLFAEEVPKKPWKNSTELSVVSANGNTKSQTASGKNTFTRNWSKTTLELIGGGLGARSQGVTSAEKYFASEKVSYKLSDRNYTFEKVGWDKDRFAGVRDRYDSGVGFGREIIKTEQQLLISELGGGYIAEDRIGSPNHNFTSGRAYSKYTYTLSPTSNFSQDAEYLHNFDNPKDFRVNTETGITSSINTNMALKVTYDWKYVGQPAKGFHRNDTITSVALVVNY